MTKPKYVPSAIMEHFEFAHLPENLQEVSKPICNLARRMDRTLPACAEKSAGLRKLLEAKDCLVRAEARKAQDQRSSSSRRRKASR